MFSTCDFDVNGSPGESINAEFKPPWYCDTSSWKITAPLNHTIKLTFETFEISDSKELGQNLIRIYDGRKATDTSLGGFTGTRRPFTARSSGRFMLVQLDVWRTISLSNLKGVYTFSTIKGKPVIFKPFRSI